MEQGIIQRSITEEEVAEYVVNSGYPDNVIPVTCILAGSRGYGLSVEDSDYDLVGIHFMDTRECIEHPRWRTSLPVIRKKFNYDLEEIPVGEKGGTISLDSFEMWKFIDLFQKGSFVVHEILFMPVIHQDPGSDRLIRLFRAGLTNKIGRAAKGNAKHDWGRDRKNRKKATMAYYRLLQAIFFLKEHEFEWRADELLEYMAVTIPTGKEIIEKYCNPATRKTPLTEKELTYAPEEIESLIEVVEKAMITTKLPDLCPRSILNEILRITRHTRSVML